MHSLLMLAAVAPRADFTAQRAAEKSNPLKTYTYILEQLLFLLELLAELCSFQNQEWYECKCSGKQENELEVYELI